MKGKVRCHQQDCAEKRKHTYLKDLSVVLNILGRHFKKIVSEYEQGNTTITNCRPTHGTTRKSHTIITIHQEDKLSKATSSLFPIKMIAKIEWT